MDSDPLVSVIAETSTSLATSVRELSGPMYGIGAPIARLATAIKVLGHSSFIWHSNASHLSLFPSLFILVG